MPSLLLPAPVLMKVCSTAVPVTAAAVAPSYTLSALPRPETVRALGVMLWLALACAFRL